MRLVMKGGVWKNAEDETLKAAVMKYGLNNWSRVASLLVRKTARQCKARWYEWLDPSVKKTPWSKDEDEKLLHMAKLFPTQWKSIASGVGRTANQCLERYNDLLDLASGKAPGADAANDPRKLRPGEIDPNPEAKPARADPVDLDEDEKEMLAEARARLANTRGKKAKRKARERQLEEARRVAMLQKRRELKAAGINMAFHGSRKKGELDYENEVPFEHKPPPGFHAVGADETPTLRHDVANMRLQQVEEYRARERMRRMRLADRRALKRLHDQDLPGAMEKIAQTANPFAVRKRSELTLPAPLVSDHELMALATSIQHSASIGEAQHRSELLKTVAGTRGLLPTSNVAGTTVTALGAATPMATASGVLRQEAIMAEARNARARTETQTPLEGGLTASLEDSQGITLQKAKKRRLATSVTATGILTGVTPVMGTSLGDAELPRGKAARRKRSKVTAKDLLAHLPEPEHDVLIGMSQQPEVDDYSDDGGIDEDERDKDLRAKRRREALLDQLSSVNRRIAIFTENLPRPVDLPESVSEIEHMLNECMPVPLAHEMSEDTHRTITEATRLINHEVARLYAADNEFITPDEHIKVFATPELYKQSRAMTRGFLTYTAKRFKDVSLRNLQRADVVIQETLDDFLTLATEEDVNEAVSSYVGEPLSLAKPTEYKGFIFPTDDECSHFQLVDARREKRSQYDESIVQRSIEAATEALEAEIAVQNTKLNKLKSREALVTEGYRQREITMLESLDKLHHKQRELEIRTQCHSVPLPETHKAIQI